MGKLKDAMIDNELVIGGGDYEESFDACSFVKDTNFSKVGEFHETFGHPYYDFRVPPIEKLTAKLTKLRLSLIFEEFAELIQAMTTKEKYGKMESSIQNFQQLIDSIQETDVELDVVEAADALGDIDYVVNGCAHVLNIDLDDVVDEIHRSNMSKADPVTGKPILRDDGKVLKGANYFKPDIAKVLRLKKEEEVPF